MSTQTITLQVNGRDVTVYGLFVEHTQEHQTLWNGERGRTYFYQNELPYDPPSQAEWQEPDGTLVMIGDFRPEGADWGAMGWSDQALVSYHPTLEQARSGIEFRLDMKPWPARAMLTCRFGHAPDHLPAEVVAHTDHMTALDTLAWRLVQQVARTLELVILREDSPQECLLTLEFPRTVTEQLEAVTAVEVETEGFAVSENSKPLAGSHVLVLAARRDLRTDIRDATRHMGLLVDFVGSVDEAEAFCRDALPHAIVYESALAGDRFQRLSREISAEVPQTAFLEIAEEGDELLLSGDGSRHARIGRDAVTASLASALLFELSREG